MAMEFELSALILAPPEAIYEAWLDSEGHTKMTGGEAKVSSEVGGGIRSLGRLHSRKESRT